MTVQEPFDPGAALARVVGVGLSLLLLGLALAFGAFFVHQLRHDLRVAQAYRQTRCTFVDRAEWPTGAPVPERATLVAYERNGAPQLAWVDLGLTYLEVEYTPAPDPALLDDSEWDRTDCWVDPDAPGDVVLGHTRWRSYGAVFFPLLFLGGGLFGLRLSLRRTVAAGKAPPGA